MNDNAEFLTLQEQTARVRAARQRMFDAGKNPRPSRRPQVLTLAPGELGERAFGRPAKVDRAVRQQAWVQEFVETQSSTYRQALEFLREDPRVIISRVAEKHGVTASDIVGASRKAEIVSARFDAIAEVKRIYPDYGAGRIGAFFGNRDHTSIRNALRQLGVSTKLEGRS